MIFQYGMDAADGTQLKPSSGPYESKYGPEMSKVKITSEPLRARATNDGAWRLAERYLMAKRARSVDALKYNLKDIWKLQDGTDLSMAEKLAKRDWNNIPIEYISDFQCFILDYYYALLRSLLDTSLLSVQEAFGDWSWNDTTIFDLVTGITNQFFPRFSKWQGCDRQSCYPALDSVPVRRF